MYTSPSSRCACEPPAAAPRTAARSRLAVISARPEPVLQSAPPPAAELPWLVDTAVDMDAAAAAVLARAHGEGRIEAPKPPPPNGASCTHSRARTPESGEGQRLVPGGMKGGRGEGGGEGREAAGARQDHGEEGGAVGER
eukprot:6191-Chlamydomonas_euryale.AAC.2